MAIIGAEETRRLILETLGHIDGYAPGGISETTPLSRARLQSLVLRLIGDHRAYAIYNVEPWRIHTVGDALRWMELSR